MEARKSRLSLFTSLNAGCEVKRVRLSPGKAADISKITVAKRLAEKTKDAEMEKIADEMSTTQIRANADADYYSRIQAAEGNRKRLSPRFLKEQLLTRMANTTKRYYGRDLADVVGSLSSAL